MGMGNNCSVDANYDSYAGALDAAEELFHCFS